MRVLRFTKSTLDINGDHDPVFFWEKQTRWTGIVSLLLVPVQFMGIYEFVAGFSLVSVEMLSWFFVLPFVLWCLAMLLFSKPLPTTVWYRLPAVALVTVWSFPFYTRTFFHK